MGLWSDFLGNQGRPIFKYRHYLPVYERHFGHLVNRPCLFWEIGVGEGGSLQMWKRWLGPDAQIVGLDINADTAHYAEDQIAVRIGDQADTRFLQDVLDEFGPPDVILDDGSHQVADQTTSFRWLYPAMSPVGVYVVEDLHTSYWPNYGGGLGRAGSFIELTKTLIDELNADHHPGVPVPITPFTHATLGIHLYDSMAVFERGRRLQKHALKTGRS